MSYEIEEIGKKPLSTAFCQYLLPTRLQLSPVTLLTQNDWLAQAGAAFVNKIPST